MEREEGRERGEGERESGLRMKGEKGRDKGRKE